MFEDHLSKRTGKHRQYTPEDFATLQRVKELSGEGIELDEIKHLVAVVDQPQDNQNKGLIVYEDFVELLESFRVTTNTLKEQIAKQQAELDELRAWINTPWYKRKRKA